jgi:antitoxin ParD1/3/4
MNISLPEELKAYADAQAGERGFGSTSEYVRDVIRRDRERERLRLLVVEGLESSQGTPIDVDHFAALRRLARS